MNSDGAGRRGKVWARRKFVWASDAARAALFALIPGGGIRLAGLGSGKCGHSRGDAAACRAAPTLHAIDPARQSPAAVLETSSAGGGPAPPPVAQRFCNDTPERQPAADRRRVTC